VNPFCLICHENIPPIIGWTALFTPEKEKWICPICEGKLEKISGETCRICSRPFHSIDEQFRNGDLCHDCVRWEGDSEWSGFLDKNESIFQYNDFLKDVIARFKFRGDYLLSKVFAESIKDRLATIEANLFVPIPLSNERLYERGFNQAEAILVEAGFFPTNLLTRIHAEKQSKKTRSERIQHPQVFQIFDEINLEGKKIVLVDDIYTTGSTLRHAAKLLKTAGADYIQSVTLAR
jgi:competence protein ComFC